MLQSYCIQGFKSIKNATEVDLKKTQYQTLEKTNVCNGILKGCMFVGANASGKTNLIEPLRFLLMALFAVREMKWKNSLCLFSDADMFENTYRFWIDNAEIEYTIRYQNTDKLLVERLVLDGKVMMERTGATAKSKITEKKVFNGIPNEGLFLRDLWFNTRFRGHEVLQKWFDFLRASQYVNMETGLMMSFGEEQSLRIEKYVEEHGIMEINQFLDECGFSFHLIHHPERNAGETGFGNLTVKRDGIMPEIPMDIESLGNKILVQFLPMYLSVIRHGGMLICDEFSSGLHNDLEELLIRYFMKHAGQAQIFIVSHSTNLLSSSLFRPDQLYAVNFDQEGSNIVRFSSEQPRTAQNYEKMYLGGVFSGIPQYKDV